MGARALVCLLSCICASSTVQVAAAQARQGHFADIERIVCAEGAERYLPGDYYFCAGNKALQAGNARKAADMFEVSAGWGDKRAMFNLGLLLYRGGDVPRNEPLGLAWLALSAERGKDRLQRETMASAWKAAKPEVRDAANALWNEMKLRYADRVALVRAQKHYERETRPLRDSFPSDRIMISGMGGSQDIGKALKTLDDAAVETILRPRTTPAGDVTVGAPETVRDPARETPKP